MRLCTAHYDVLMPAMFAGTTPWSARVSIEALINGQPSGY
jgi:hypothetical protein